MRKIVFYVGCILRTGGAERVMANLANYFFERNYDVLLITDLADMSNEAEYPLNKEIKRIVTGEEDKNVVLKNLRRLKKLRECIKAYNPDIVLSFMRTPNIRMLLSTIGLPCKKVVSVRNAPDKEYGKGIRRYIVNRIFSFADGFVFQTDKVGMYFHNKINQLSKVISNPVSSSFFDTIWHGDDKTIVCMGRLEAQKNYALLLKAFARIYDEIPGYELILCGDGSLKEPLKQISMELGIERRVIFAGTITNVEAVLAGAALFVLPSDFEGMPNALMEAMAVGVPCIATDCPIGGPEMLFSDELSQYLVPCGNEQKLAEMILAILKLPEDKYKEIGLKMKERAEMFRAEKVYIEWEEFLKSICKRKEIL